MFKSIGAIIIDKVHGIGRIVFFADNGSGLLVVRLRFPSEICLPSILKLSLLTSVCHANT